MKLMKTLKKFSGGLAILSLIVGFAGPSVAFAATTVSLGNADSFAVLGGSGISNTGTTTINGDVGSFPTNTQTGFGPGANSVTITGTNHFGDGVTQGAKTALVTAFTNAGQPTTGVIAADLGGQILTPGVYDDNNAPDSLSITGTLTLDGGGDPNAVFIFKTGSTLTTSSASHVNLINGAQACNVFWQIGSSVTLGTTSDFKGNILAMDSITDNGGSTVSGRLLARNALVTLNNSTVNKATCAAAVTPSPGFDVLNNTLTILKHIVNDNGGTATSFPLFVNGQSVINGQSLSLAPGDYTVSETSLPNYKATFSGDCDANGVVHHRGINTHNDVCIITNDDIGTPPVVPPVPPLIDVVKVPNPLALPNGPGPVTYTYTLRNIGTVPVTDITMVGDTCSPIVLASGDTNNNAKLEVNETWVYRCATNLTATHTNTVVATGWANGLSTNDIASATVAVGVPAVPPLIHVTKIPSPLALSNGGGSVTYTEKVTNPGTVALSNVTLVDDKCSPMKLISGDVNNDSKLDTTETWTYTCKTNLTSTTTNTAIATGEANGFVVRDLAVATVVVTPKVAAPAPKLPNTGFLPATGVSTGVAATAGLIAASIAFYVVRKRQNA